MRFFAISNMDFLGVSGVGCLTSLNHYHSLVFILLLPLAIIVFLSLLVLLGRFYFRYAQLKGCLCCLWTCSAMPCCFLC